MSDRLAGTAGVLLVLGVAAWPVTGDWRWAAAGVLTLLAVALAGRVHPARPAAADWSTHTRSGSGDRDRVCVWCAKARAVPVGGGDVEWVVSAGTPQECRHETLHGRT